MALYQEFEQLFANTVLELGLCDEPAMEKALQVQEKALAKQEERSISEILVAMEFLTKGQAAKIAAMVRERLDIEPEIDGYDNLKKIRYCGMAVLYSAHQQSVDREVVLKILPSAGMQSTPMQKRFNQEARLRARLNHKNIVGSIDFGANNVCYYSVLVHVRGGEYLDMQLKHGQKFSTAKTAQCILDLAEALQHINKQKMVHGNVSPENIITVGGGHAWLTGFDFIAEIGVPATIIGGMAPRYLPPDNPKNPNLLSDFYALGCTLFEMLTLRNPQRFPHGETPVATAYSVLADRGLAAIAYTLMQPDPALRYQNFETLFADLSAVCKRETPAHALPLPCLSQKIASVIPDWPRRRPAQTALYAAAAVAGVLLAVGTFLICYGIPSKSCIPQHFEDKEHWQSKASNNTLTGREVRKLWVRANADKTTPADREKIYQEILSKYPGTAYANYVAFLKAEHK